MIYERLRELKGRSGMSTQQISDRSGLPASTISRILSGQTDSPGFQTVCDLVRAMGGSLDELAGLSQGKIELQAVIPLYDRALELSDRDDCCDYCVSSGKCDDRCERGILAHLVAEAADKQ